MDDKWLDRLLQPPSFIFMEGHEVSEENYLTYVSVENISSWMWWMN